jgi:hypothetical protein
MRYRMSVATFVTLSVKYATLAISAWKYHTIGQYATDLGVNLTPPGDPRA